MLRSFHCAPGFDETHRETSLTGRSAPPIAALSWPALTGLRTMCDALGEGLAAYRRYEHLRSMGVLPETALREALGIGVARSQAAPAAPKLSPEPWGPIGARLSPGHALSPCHRPRRRTIQ